MTYELKAYRHQYLQNSFITYLDTYVFQSMKRRERERERESESERERERERETKIINKFNKIKFIFL